MLEEGYRVDSSALCLIEEFLKKFPLSPKSRNMSTFPPELFAKAANLVDLNLIQAILSAVEQAPDLQLNKLSMKSIDLSIVSPKALEKVARKLQIWDISNAALSPTQCNAIIPALLINSDIKEINLSDNSLSSVLPENVAKAVQKSRSFLLANTSLTVHQVEAILTAVSSEASYLHTLDLSNNLLSVLEPKLLGDALMTLESATLDDTSLTVAQVCRD